MLGEYRLHHNVGRDSETGDLQEQLCPSQKTATYSLKKKIHLLPGEVSAPYAISSKFYP